MCSLFFYGFWNPKYIYLIIISILINYFFHKVMEKIKKNKKGILILGIAFNLSLLGYFKYSNFFIDNMNLLFHTNIQFEKIALPLAISFFTFQQIAFIVDSYKGLAKNYSFLEYCLFVTFFPQLIAGPIVHHSEMMPQFYKKQNGYINSKNVTLGIYIFAIGLFKKVLIADNFALIANTGFNTTKVLTFFESWFTSLAYTFQLYFDFSGYCDMAIGAALLFNIKLPINFNSPYKSLNIAEFWRRWHITLGRFFTRYLYIPLGGNRKGELYTLEIYLSSFF